MKPWVHPDPTDGHYLLRKLGPEIAKRPILGRAIPYRLDRTYTCDCGRGERFYLLAELAIGESFEVTYWLGNS